MAILFVSLASIAMCFNICPSSLVCYDSFEFYCKSFSPSSLCKRTKSYWANGVYLHPYVFSDQPLHSAAGGQKQHIMRKEKIIPVSRCHLVFVWSCLDVWIVQQERFSQLSATESPRGVGCV